jgi:hypothetical protein
MELVIYVAMEVAGHVKPRACTDEDVPGKPLWTVVASGSTIVRSDVVITVRAFRSRADLDADLPRLWEL